MPVAEHRRLRFRGRAAGEEEHGHRLGIDEGVLSASFGFATEHRVGESIDVTMRPASTPAERNRTTSPASARIGPGGTRGRIDASCSSGAR